MISDEDFLASLTAAASDDDEAQAEDLSVEQSADGEEGEMELSDGMYADGMYGSEEGVGADGDGDYEFVKEKDEAEKKFDDMESGSEMDEFMEGLEEDELERQGLKMPSDLEGDDEDGEEEDSEGGL